MLVAVVCVCVCASFYIFMHILCSVSIRCVCICGRWECEINRLAVFVPRLLLFLFCLRLCILLILKTRTYKSAFLDVKGCCALRCNISFNFSFFRKRSQKLKERHIYVFILGVIAAF